MTILDCLFYAFDSLSLDVSLELNANLVVAWMYDEIPNLFLVCIDFVCSWNFD